MNQELSDYWLDVDCVDPELADADSVHKMLMEALAMARRHGWREAELLIQRAAEELPGEY